MQPSLHYQTDVPVAGGEPDPADVAAGIWALMASAFLAATPSTVTCHELLVTEQVLKPDIGAQAIRASNQAGTIAVGQEDLPRELVPILNIYSDTASRSARGYTTLAGPGSETFTNLRLWTATYVTLLEQFATNASLSFDLGTLQVTHVHPVVYSRTRHQRGQDPYTFRVKSVRVNERPHWRRSRGTTP